MISHARLDSSRESKARKILAVLGDSLKKANVLEIGTGSGHIVAEIAKKASKVVSVDLNDERVIKKGYSFKKVKDEKLPFEYSSFDVVISNQVVEHVKNQKLHLAEIHRVLKKGGICYLATPNKWFIIEPHYRLPLLSWLPRVAAKAYLWLAKGKKWDIYPLSYGKLKEPKKYCVDDFKALQPVLRVIPSFLLSMLNCLLPSYVVLLRKK
jgi:ubiquinone/menaquinone biosynthesis C-methylase UbiE